MIKPAEAEVPVVEAPSEPDEEATMIKANTKLMKKARLQIEVDEDEENDDSGAGKGEKEKEPIQTE